MNRFLFQDMNGIIYVCKNYRDIIYRKFLRT